MKRNYSKPAAVAAAAKLQSVTAALPVSVIIKPM
jgi:hypothetical protein